MQYLVTRGEKGKVEVKVDVAKAGFIEAYGKVLKKLGTETKIAGFRPGKVPTEILSRFLILPKIGENKYIMSRQFEIAFIDFDIIRDSADVRFVTINHHSYSHMAMLRHANRNVKDGFL